MTCDRFNNPIVSKRVLDPVLNPLPTGPNMKLMDDKWYEAWYYRDKPLKTVTEKPGQKYWVDGGILDYEMRLCFDRGLDCTETCCKGTYCSPKIGECIHYVHRDFSEIYICIAVVFAIVLGIPTCIRTMELLLMFKFCKTRNDEENTYSGGMTLLEALTVCWQKNSKEKEEITIKKEEDEDEINEDLEMEAIVADKINNGKSEGGGIMKNRGKPAVKKGTCKTFLMACCCCKTDNTQDYTALKNQDLERGSGRVVGFAESSKLE